MSLVCAEKRFSNDIRELPQVASSSVEWRRDGMSWRFVEIRGVLEFTLGVVTALACSNFSVEDSRLVRVSATTAFGDTQSE